MQPRDFLLYQGGVTGDVVPVIAVVGVAGDDAGELGGDQVERLVVMAGTVLAVVCGEDVFNVLRGGGGVGTLEVQESFDRAWRRVGLALDRVGFTVEDRDRSKGLYFVRYVDPEADGANKDPGLLSKLAFWKDAPPDPKTRYRIFVKDSGGTSSIQVLSTEGGIDQSETAKRILNLLFEQLK